MSNWQFTGVSVGMDLAIIVVLFTGIWGFLKNIRVTKEEAEKNRKEQIEREKEQIERENAQNAKAISKELPLIVTLFNEHMDAANKLTNFNDALQASGKSADPDNFNNWTNQEKHQYIQIENARAQTLKEIKLEIAKLQLSIATFGNLELFRSTRPYFLAYKRALNGEGYNTAEEYRKFGARHALLSVPCLVNQAIKAAQKNDDIADSLTTDCFGMKFMEIHEELQEFPKLMKID